jgi:hypothetical protein
MAYLKNFREAEGGQLFIIGAIALTLIFVGLTILLNTAIYTDNLASRGTNVGGNSQELVQRDVVNYVDTNMEYVNTNQNEYLSINDKQNAQEEMIMAWADMNSIDYAQQGRIVRVSNPAIDRGLRIGQEDISRDFTSPSGDTDWLVSGENNKVRDFDLIVDRNSLSTGLSSQFTVHLLESGEYKITNKSAEIRIGKSGSNRVEVTVIDSDVQKDTCTTPATDGYAHIELAEGKVGGDDCEALEKIFVERSSSGYPLYYENADNVEGTWNLYSERSRPYTFVPPQSRPSFTYPSDPSSGNPFEYRAIYATAVTVEISSEDGVISRTIRVAPGEHE